MKKKEIPNNKGRSSIVVPTALKTEFRKLCIVQDLKPCDVAKQLFENWVEKQKKKSVKIEAVAANG